MSDWDEIEGVPEAIEQDEKQKALLLGYGQIFAQLLDSERFRDLFAMYFTLTKVVDDSAKMVTFQVIENPPEVIAKRMTAAQGEQAAKIEVVDASKAKKLLKQVTRKQ